jgi:hypothetical protein
VKKSTFARFVFFAYLIFIAWSYYTKNDRLTILAMAVLAGLGYLWRVMYVEDSERIIQFFDARIKDVASMFLDKFNEVNARIDKHHPPENEKKHD